jgi:hypothetical protein
VKEDENNEVLVELQTTKQKVNKHNKNLKKIRVERDSLQVTLI